MKVLKRNLDGFCGFLGMAINTRPPNLAGTTRREIVGLLFHCPVLVEWQDGAVIIRRGPHLSKGPA